MAEIIKKIEDDTYKGALLEQNKTIRPFHAFPKPTDEQFKQYVEHADLSLEEILDSPIGVYEFKKYVRVFEDFPAVIEFLVEFEKVANADSSGATSAKFLMELALRLPVMYMDHVSEIRTAFLEVFKDEDFILAEDAFPLEGPARSEMWASLDPSRSYSKEVAEFNLADRMRRKQTKLLSEIPQAGSFLSPFGRSSFSFGGYKHIKREVNPMAAKESAIDTEFVDIQKFQTMRKEKPEETEAENPDFYDRLVAEKEKDNEIKLKMKDNAISVFADLANVLRPKAEELLAEFKKDTEEYIELVNMLWYSEQDIKPDDFLLFRDLGRGAFGVVSSAKTKTTGTLTAIKCMNKKLVKGKKAKRVVIVEKAILQVLGDNPSNFTIWLKHSFEDEDYFYMALPLCTGGDLRYHLSRRICFEEYRAKFHFAEILEGIDHLHSLGIVYRDLKPENVIFDSEGHCRISDMGLAVQTNGNKIMGRAGTPGYWAPEVMDKKPYSYSADFWTMGCVLFELLVGICPYHPRNTRMKWEDGTKFWPLKFPSMVGNKEKKETMKPFPEGAKGLITGLLSRSRSKRFGAKEIRRDAFMADIDWFKLRRGELEAPWKTTQGRIYAAHQADIQNNDNESNFRNVKLTEEDIIEGFNYTSKYSHQLDIVHVLETRDRGKLEYGDAQLQGLCCSAV